MMYHLHDGFISKTSFEYKRAKWSADTDLYSGMMFLVLGLGMIGVAIICNSHIWWNVVLGTLVYLPASGVLLRRYYASKKACYGLQRGI